MANASFHTRHLFSSIVAAAALAGAVATTGCTAAGTAAGDSTPVAHVQPATTPRLEGADNFRDLGGLGEGYPTTDGGHVARGVVYRSNALALTGADLAALAKLDVSDVIDLRTTAEIEAKPDTEIPGATWVHDDVLGSVASLSAPTFTTAAEAEALMDGAYEAMVTSPDARKAIGAALTTIADAKGAVIVHCTRARTARAGPAPSCCTSRGPTRRRSTRTTC
ncbi:hypothetical protein ABIA36_002467 [Leifsonia sp. EB34]